MITQAIPDNTHAETEKFLLAAIVDSSDDAIISKTLRGIITSWNRAAENLFGYSQQEVIGRHISLLIPEDRIQEEDMIIAKIVSGEKVDHFQTVRMAKNGREIPISLTISPIRDTNNQIIGASKVARDITRQLELEQQVILSNLELQQSNLYKDEFIGLVGHELKTPVSSIKSYLQLTHVFPERGAEFIAKAEKQIDKLNLLLSALLDMALVQAAKFSLQVAPLPVNQFLMNAIETTQQAHPSHHIQYDLQTAGLELPVDALRMEQVITNLLNNAIKYSPAANRVLVRATQQQDELLISVQDFGIGIAIAHQPHIFDRFFRASHADGAIHGLGLGLHIVREIVTLHRGKIWLQSEEGSGSTFFVSLPLSS